MENVLYTELMDGDLNWEQYHPYFDSKKCILDIARGIHYIHTQTPMIIHRDIKIDNMMVKKEGGVVTQTKLGDFGFAVVCPDGYYIDYDKTGTPHYMAYEIVEPNFGEKVYYTPASDMWAFGIVCWHIFAKKPIYPSVTTCIGYRRYIINGYRENFDGIKGDKILFDMIQRCWYEDVTSRPKAIDFIEYLSKDEKEQRDTCES
jgi:serine/threonine protein kinase